jgi:RNA polymerase sigma factor (sigma-70 family)
MPPPLHRRQLSTESWDALFDFLDPSRSTKQGLHRDAEAESRFAEITRKLEYFFAGRGCRDAEDLAAETVMRVAAKCTELSVVTFADCIAYFYGVARHVLHEWLRETRRASSNLESAGKDPTLLPDWDPQLRKKREDEHRCLDRCMANLTQGARRLILNYYSADKASKIAGHREIAAQFGKSLNALRIEVHRVRNTLRRCVFDCMHASTGSGDCSSLRGAP